MKYFVAGLLQPFFWLITLSIALWLTRKFIPRAEYWLFTPISRIVWQTIRRLRTPKASESTGTQVAQRESDRPPSR